MRLQVVWSHFGEEMSCCPSIIPESCAHWNPLQVQSDIGAEAANTALSYRLAEAYVMYPYVARYQLRYPPCFVSAEGMSQLLARKEQQTVQQRTHYWRTNKCASSTVHYIIA